MTNTMKSSLVSRLAFCHFVSRSNKLNFLLCVKWIVSKNIWKLSRFKQYYCVAHALTFLSFLSANRKQNNRFDSISAMKDVTHLISLNKIGDKRKIQRKQKLRFILTMKFHWKWSLILLFLFARSFVSFSFCKIFRELSDKREFIKYFYHLVAAFIVSSRQ